MAQTITDFKSFLEDAKEAVTELSDFTKKEEQLRMEELRLEKSLEASLRGCPPFVRADFITPSIFPGGSGRLLPSF